MKRIDDAELLRMLREGKSQKEAAAHFGVSLVAICKRLKRILPQPADVLAGHDLTEQQKRFVLAKAQGKTNTKAALQSYEVRSLESAKVIGSQLMDNPAIKTALKELVEHHIPQNYRLKRLRGHVDHVDPVVSLKALDLSWKLDGSYSENREVERYPRTITLQVVGAVVVNGKAEVVELTAPNRASIGKADGECK